VVLIVLERRDVQAQAEDEEREKERVEVEVKVGAVLVSDHDQGTV